MSQQQYTEDFTSRPSNNRTNTKKVDHQSTTDDEVSSRFDAIDAIDDDDGHSQTQLQGPGSLKLPGSSRPLTTPNAKKSVKKYDNDNNNNNHPFSWFRKTMPAAIRDRGSIPSSSPKSTRSPGRLLDTSVSSTFSSKNNNAVSTSPMKFTRHGRHHHRPLSRHHGRPNSMAATSEESPKSQRRSESPGYMTVDDLSEWRGKRPDAHTSETHASPGQLHVAREVDHRDDSASLSGSSNTSSDSFERATLCWEASVGPKRSDSCPGQSVVDQRPTK